MEEDCAICSEQMFTEFYILECGHTFHYNCLQRWTKNTCPLCRTDYSLKFIPPYSLWRCKSVPQVPDFVIEIDVYNRNMNMLRFAQGLGGFAYSS
jgi:hypothetical protein